MKKTFLYVVNCLILLLILFLAYTSLSLELEGKSNLYYAPLVVAITWIVACVILIIKFRSSTSKMRLLSYVNSCLLLSVVLVSGFWGVWNFLNDDLSFCSDDIQKIVLSPDSTYKAIAYVRNCGATTDFSPQVVLGKSSLSNKEMISKSENVIFVGNHSYIVDIRWRDADVLEIISDLSSSNIIKHVTQKYGINILYNYSKHN